MSRFFFSGGMVIAILLAILFFPIYLETYAHYDMNRRKFGFALYAYKKIPVLGGYIGTYPGGIALHTGKERAILIPFNKMNSERKKFSIVKTFRLKKFILTTESGAEYLFITAITHSVLRLLFFIKDGEKEGIENNLWLTDGDVLRISFHSLLYFNIFILLKSFLKFCKEKISYYVRQKSKN